MHISPCNSYHAVIENCHLLPLSDGKSAFKVYFCSIVGRATPERFQWDLSPLTKDQILCWLGGLGLSGIGFITAFPHITKVFRFSPENETLVNVGSFNTPTGAVLSLDRPGGYTEFGCLAEAMLAADEFRAWGCAETVQEYLDFVSTATDVSIRSHHKLADYFKR